jgi:hypothetical protein
MAAWTAASFKAARQEFATLADAAVTLALSDATSELDPRVFGDTFDQAVGLLAAHKLSVSPFGQQARLEPKTGDGTTTYHAELQRLTRKKAGGFWAVGRGASGGAL